MHSYPIPVYFLSLHCWSPPIQTSPYRITSITNSCQIKPCMVCPAPAALSPPQLSCSNDRRVQHSRDPASRLSFAASDLLPRCWQPWNCITIINRADDLEDYTGPQERSHSFVSAYVMHRLILHATLSSCSPIRLWVRSKLVVKLEFLNGCGVYIGVAMSTICLLSG